MAACVFSPGGLERCAVVESDYLLRPGENVDGPLTGRLRPNPKLKVFRPIIATYAVPVVDVFAGKQGPPKSALHHDCVFGTPAALGLDLDVSPFVSACCPDGMPGTLRLTVAAMLGAAINADSAIYATAPAEVALPLVLAAAAAGAVVHGSEVAAAGTVAFFGPASGRARGADRGSALGLGRSLTALLAHAGRLRALSAFVVQPILLRARGKRLLASETDARTSTFATCCRELLVPLRLSLGHTVVASRSAVRVPGRVAAYTEANTLPAFLLTALLALLVLPLASLQPLLVRALVAAGATWVLNPLAAGAKTRRSGGSLFAIALPLLLQAPFMCTLSTVWAAAEARNGDWSSAVAELVPFHADYATGVCI